MLNIYARAFALATIGAFATAAVAAEPKPIKIQLPASALKDPAGRVCMPRETLGRKVDKTLPATICETRDQWAERGVIFELH
jgi:hypothetical protein